MRNYVLTQKNNGDTISAHVRLKEILNNIMNIILYLQALKLQLPIGYSWKKLNRANQSTSLYIKSNIIRSHLFPWLGLVV